MVIVSAHDMVQWIFKSDDIVAKLCILNISILSDFDMNKSNLGNSNRSALGKDTMNRGKYTFYTDFYWHHS